MPIVSRVTSRTHSKERTPSSSFHIRARTFFIRNSLYQEHGKHVWSAPHRARSAGACCARAPTFSAASQCTCMCRAEEIVCADAAPEGPLRRCGPVSLGASRCRVRRARGSPRHVAGAETRTRLASEARCSRRRTCRQKKTPRRSSLAARRRVFRAAAGWPGPAAGTGHFRCAPRHRHGEDRGSLACVRS